MKLLQTVCEKAWLQVFVCLTFFQQDKTHNNNFVVVAVVTAMVRTFPLIATLVFKLFDNSIIVGRGFRSSCFYIQTSFLTFPLSAAATINTVLKPHY